MGDDGSTIALMLRPRSTPRSSSSRRDLPTPAATDVAEIGQAFELLSPLLGLGMALDPFAVALLASGLNSTVTATLVGQS